MHPQESTAAGRPALCIINHNGARYLPATLARVREMRAQFSEIAFVDDASQDASVELARELLPTAQILALPTNRGPAVARNAGLAVLTADRVLFLDNDVVLHTDALSKLMRSLDEHPRAVISMPRIVSADDPDQIEYEGGDAHFSGLMLLRAGTASSPPGPPQTTSVGSLVSCCFLFDQTRWRDGQLFDELFHMYLEDHELGLRARMLGHDLLAVPDAVGLHGKGTPGVSLRDTGEYTRTRILGMILHRWFLLLKLYQTRTLILLSPYLVVFEAFQLAGAVVLGWGRHWLSAIYALLSSTREVRASRAAFKEIRREPDLAVLTGGAHPFNPALQARFVVRLAHRALDTFAGLNWAFARRLMAGRIVQ